MGKHSRTVACSLLGLFMLCTDASTISSRRQAFRYNCPAFDPMCPCPTFQNGCFVCKCLSSGSNSSVSGSSSGSISGSSGSSNSSSRSSSSGSSDSFGNFHPGEFPGSSGSSSNGSYTLGSYGSSNGSSSGTSGSSGSSGNIGTPSRSGSVGSGGSSGNGSSSGGPGSLVCAPLPGNCPPFMVKQDSQGCAICSSSGSGGGSVAGQLNNCPPVDYTCPTLHIDRNGCLLCGSVNGGWGSWTSWYPCSVTCGNGIQRRERYCNRPPLSHGGSGCHGNATEIQTCNPARCHEGLTCLSCQGVLFPHTCDTVEHCGTHSICSTEMYFDGSGYTLYNLGCKDAAFCHSRSIRFLPDVSNITIDNSFRSHIPYCRECCNTSMCNVKGCGNSGYADDRGPLCFSCTQQQTLDSCNTIKLCGRDEECSIEGKNFGPVDYFTSSCKVRKWEKNCKQHRSYSTKRLDYYRRSAHVCERCCSSDLCNHRTC